VNEKLKRYSTARRRPCPSPESKKFLSQQIRGRVQENTSTSTRNLVAQIRPLIKQWLHYFKNTDGLHSIRWKEKRKLMAWIDRHVYSSRKRGYKEKRGARLQKMEEGRTLNETSVNTNPKREE
jgi:hypothetical protein